MIYPNQAARDYEFRVVVEMSKQRAPHIRAMVGGANMGIGFGNGSPFGAQIVSVYDANDSEGRWRARFFCNSLGIAEDDDGELWQNDLSMRIKFTNAVLETDCDAWRIDSDDILWYVKPGSASEYLAYQHGAPWFLLGNEYDARFNCLSGEALAYLGTEDVRVAVLPHTPQFGPSEVYQILNASTFGWRYTEGSTTVEPDVKVDQTFNVPDTDCDCDEPPGVIGTDSPPTVWEVTLNTELLVDIDQVPLGRYTCYCDPDHPEIGTPTVRDVYRMDEEYVLLPISARFYPKDAKIRTRTVMARARCSDPLANPFYYEDPYTYYGPFTITEDETVIQYNKGVIHMDAYKYYAFLVSPPGNCPTPLPDDPPSPPPICHPTGTDICWYEADADVEHAKPPCDELTDSHMWTDSQGRLYTVLSGGSEIQVWRHKVNGTSDVQFVASAEGLAQGGFSPKGHHVIVYRGPQIES